MNYRTEYQKALARAIIAERTVKKLEVSDIHDKWVSAMQRIAELEAQLAHKQFEIDNLMLEHCPDEMTVEQLDRWESCQVPEVVEELEAQVDAIRDEYLNHVEATKSPVIVLDAIGWILEQKAAIKGEGDE